MHEGEARRTTTAYGLSQKFTEAVILAMFSPGTKVTYVFPNSRRQTRKALLLAERIHHDLDIDKKLDLVTSQEGGSLWFELKDGMKAETVSTPE